jgi:cholesterol oxidase
VRAFFTAIFSIPDPFTCGTKQIFTLPYYGTITMNIRSEFTEPELFDRTQLPRRKRQLRVEPPSIFYFDASDGVQLRLTRYQGGSRGPVLLSHCIGVSQRMYSTDTVDTNLLEYLYENGYDIWLLDHRLSIELPAAYRQSTMDDVATKDYPAAVSKALELSRAKNLQVVAHGVGSSTFTMAMLAGLQGVRAAVCSQVSTDLLVPSLNLFKSYLTPAAKAFGIRLLDTYTDGEASPFSHAYNWAIKFYPMETEERCKNPVCQRISGLFGNLYEHAQLNAATHCALHEIFGVVNLRAMAQLSRISIARHLVNAAGENVYLPYLNRLAIPIVFIHGAENVCVLPKSTELALDRLTKANGPGLYQRHLIPNYAHVDCILGKNAVNDVYPLILSHLNNSDG